MLCGLKVRQVRVGVDTGSCLDAGVAHYLLQLADAFTFGDEVIGEGVA